MSARVHWSLPPILLVAFAAACGDDDSSSGSGGTSGGGASSGGASSGGSAGNGGSAGTTSAGAGGAGGVGATGGGSASGGAGGSSGGAGGSGGDADASTCTPVTTPAGQVLDCAGATIAKTIDISGFAFGSPSTLIKVGEIVKFDNKDFSTHTATSGTPGCKDGNWDTGDIAANGSKCVKLVAAGAFPFFCAIHPSMTATLVVTN